MKQGLININIIGLIRPSETIMNTINMNKQERENIVNTLAANVAAAYLDYREGLINAHAYNMIRYNACMFASSHLDSYTDLIKKLAEKDI